MQSGNVRRESTGPMRQGQSTATAAGIGGVAYVAALSQGVPEPYAAMGALAVSAVAGVVGTWARDRGAERDLLLYRLLALLGCCALFVASPVQAEDTSITYQEPSTKVDGTALDDLALIRVLTTQDGEVVLSQEFPASGPSGGQVVTQETAVDVQPGEFEVYVVAVNKRGEASEASNTQTLVVPSLAPPSPPVLQELTVTLELRFSDGTVQTKVVQGTP